MYIKYYEGLYFRKAVLFYMAAGAGCIKLITRQRGWGIFMIF